MEKFDIMKEFEYTERLRLRLLEALKVDQENCYPDSAIFALMNMTIDILMCRVEQDKDKARLYLNTGMDSLITSYTPREE